MTQETQLRSVQGLTGEEAAKRLAAEGYNELPSSRPRSFVSVAMAVLREPMILLLLAAGMLYLSLGDIAETLLLLASISFIVAINLYQERRTERALAALRDLSSPRALVIRDGEHLRIPGREVARGDALLISEGDRVPADAVLRAGTNVLVDESLLTGESISVSKTASETITAMEPPGGDDLPFLFSGSLVVAGTGLAEALATGTSTQFGRIGASLAGLREEPTRIQVETRRIVRLLASIALMLCLIVSLVHGMATNWKDGLLSGITLAIAIIPEEFPVVLTVFLAFGAWRLSRKRVLTRRVPAVETLGATTVLCVDKTGTLTLNQMAVRRLFANNQVYELDSDVGELPVGCDKLVQSMALAGQADSIDPMEQAIQRLLASLARSAQPSQHARMVRQYPLSPALLAMSQVWRVDTGPELSIGAKGAPEAIAQLCRLEGDALRELSHRVDEMAVAGLRVLGVAWSRSSDELLPEDQRDLKLEFVGLVGLIDPLRPGVPAAINECASAGIRVVMITGDYPVTARQIGLEAGLPTGVTISGAELDAMSEAELSQRVGESNIFARVVPEQKLRLVNSLKANGEIVAMTGDGVNDAPALKAAHIGIAMGERGTDVAREAASLVLLDDDFGSIVRAVRIGRGIFDNLRKAIAYLLAVHIPIAGLSLLPVILGTPLTLFPAHIVFLELIIDPACSIVFEAEPPSPNVMRRPPRPVNERLFNSRLIALSLIDGICVMLVVLAVYFISWESTNDEARARSMTFVTLIVSNLALILTNRSTSRAPWEMLSVRNRPLWWLLAGTTLLLSVALYVPFFQELFGFETLNAKSLSLSLGAGLLSIPVLEIAKRLSARVGAPD